MPKKEIIEFERNYRTGEYLPKRLGYINTDDGLLAIFITNKKNKPHIIFSLDTPVATVKNVETKNYFPVSLGRFLLSDGSVARIAITATGIKIGVEKSAVDNGALMFSRSWAESKAYLAKLADKEFVIKKRKKRKKKGDK